MFKYGVICQLHDIKNSVVLSCMLHIYPPGHDYRTQLFKGSDILLQVLRVLFSHRSCFLL